MRKAYVFDLDDTLYPEAAYVSSGFDAVAAAFGLDRDHLRELYALDRKNVFDRYAALGGTASPADMHRVYIEHMPRIALFDDVLPCLERLRDAGCRLGLITDGRPIQQHRKLDALGIRGRFDKIIVTDELGIEHRKPDPLPFRIMAEAVAVAYKDIVYVGDNPAKDFAVAAQLPITTVHIRRGEGLYNGAYRDGIRPAYRIKGLEELA